MMSELKYDQDICERMIAHSRGSLVERYDKSTRWPERVAAANEYSEEVLRIACMKKHDIGLDSNPLEELDIIPI